MSDWYVAGDYAGLKGGDYSFYYGYEETVPEKPDDDDWDREWAFVAKLCGIESYRWTAKELGCEQFDPPQDVLMAGIARFLEKVSGND